LSKLFESTSINTLFLRNRLIRSATWEGLASPDGSVTQRLIDKSLQLVRGGIGLVITGHAFVSPEGRAGRLQLGAYSDTLLPGFIEMTGAIHDEGGRIVMQLAHSGLRAPAGSTGLAPIGPSPWEGPYGGVKEAMAAADMEATISSFADAASRAKQAGFDGVQIHAAHGYLISQFLSPHYNRRQDEYGGPIENRARFAVEILMAVRRAVGHDFPVLIKINAEDYLEDGFTVEDMVSTSRMLEDAGIDAVEMSGGTFDSGSHNSSRPGKPGPAEPEAYYEAAARRFKKSVNIPLMLVGGIRTFETAEQLVGQGVADYICLSRPLIREPELAKRWMSGDRRPAACISDNGCFKPGFEGKGVYCVVAARS
jgi:2,4-dienoyl-CoA reductase-like NADH-dependent reductase (Old Yellow Enzyme family)